MARLTIEVGQGRLVFVDQLAASQGTILHNRFEVEGCGVLRHRNSLRLLQSITWLTLGKPTNQVVRQGEEPWFMPVIDHIIEQGGYTRESFVALLDRT